MNPYEPPLTSPGERSRKIRGQVCPHCGQPGISILRRAFLGPGLPTKCTACGKRVGVGYGRTLLIGMIGMPPIVAAFAAYMFFGYSVWIHIGILICVASALTVLSFRLVPLVKR